VKAARDEGAGKPQLDHQHRRVKAARDEGAGKPQLDHQHRRVKAARATNGPPDPR
jgi:hypothetical protein